MASWSGCETMFRLLVPSDKVGCINSFVLDKIMKETRSRIQIIYGLPGTEIAVMVLGKDDPQSSLSPSMDGLLRVHMQIVDGLDGEACQPPPASKVSTRLLVPASQAGSLIGQQGGTVKAIQEASGCIVKVFNFKSEDLPFVALQHDIVVEIVGEATSVHKALELIASHLRKFLVDRFFEDQEPQTVAPEQATHGSVSAPAEEFLIAFGAVKVSLENASSKHEQDEAQLAFNILFNKLDQLDQSLFPSDKNEVWRSLMAQKLQTLQELKKLDTPKLEEHRYNTVYLSKHYFDSPRLTTKFSTKYKILELIKRVHVKRKRKWKPVGKLKVIGRTGFAQIVGIYYEKLPPNKTDRIRLRENWELFVEAENLERGDRITFGSGGVGVLILLEVEKGSLAQNQSTYGPEEAWEDDMQEEVQNQQDWEDDRQEVQNQQDWEDDRQEEVQNQQDWEDDRQEEAQNQQDWEDDRQEEAQNQQDWEDDRQEEAQNQQDWEDDRQPDQEMLSFWIAKSKILEETCSSQKDTIKRLEETITVKDEQLRQVECLKRLLETIMETCSSQKDAIKRLEEELAQTLKETCFSQKDKIQRLEEELAQTLKVVDELKTTITVKDEQLRQGELCFKRLFDTFMKEIDEYNKAKK